VSGNPERRKQAVELKGKNMLMLNSMIHLRWITPGEAAAWFSTIDRASSVESQERLNFTLLTLVASLKSKN
jgi:hypothetical protein